MIRSPFSKCHMLCPVALESVCGRVGMVVVSIVALWQLARGQVVDIVLVEEKRGE